MYCCNKIQINYGPISFIFARKEFFDFRAVIDRALANHDPQDMCTEIGFRIGMHSTLRLSPNDLCDFNLCLVTATEKLTDGLATKVTRQLLNDTTLN